MIITPELIEKHSRAYYARIRENFDWAPSWDDMGELAQKGAIDDSRAALTAILPDIVEAIAKVAKDMVWARHSDEEVAEAIRQLGREET